MATAVTRRRELARPPARAVSQRNVDGLVEEARHALRGRVADPRTEAIYVAWIRRFLEFAAPESPEDIGELEVDAFVAYLALARGAGPVACKRARRAVTFLRVVVLGQGRVPGRRSGGEGS